MLQPAPYGAVVILLGDMCLASIPTLVMISELGSTGPRNAQRTRSSSFLCSVHTRTPRGRRFTSLVPLLTIGYGNVHEACFELLLPC